MSNPAESQARRRFLKIAVSAAAVAPVAAVVLPRIALAQDLPTVDPATDATAKALHYVDDAAKAKDNPSFKAGSDCANCQFYTGKAGAELGPCALFPGKSVHAKGWCASWAKKA